MLSSSGFVSNILHTHRDAERPPHDFFFRSFAFVIEFWVCFEHSTHTSRCLTPTPRFFLSEFWICYRVRGLFRTFHTHTPRCLTPAPRFSLSEFWVCYRVLGLFRTFHTHIAMLNAHPTIFSFGVLGLLSSFSFFN